jgi:hypothetical protein
MSSQQNGSNSRFASKRRTIINLYLGVRACQSIYIREEQRTKNSALEVLKGSNPLGIIATLDQEYLCLAHGRRLSRSQISPRVLLSGHLSGLLFTTGPCETASTHLRLVPSYSTRCRLSMSLLLAYDLALRLLI